MSLWNPYAFTPTGQPVAPAAPPALRVIGGQASAQQLGMAQQAFAQFSERARLSVVPNPVEAGCLPDGTPYKIIDVAGVRTMMIWPVEMTEVSSDVYIGLYDITEPVTKFTFTTKNGKVTYKKVVFPAFAEDHPSKTWPGYSYYETEGFNKGINDVSDKGVFGAKDYFFEYYNVGFVRGTKVLKEAVATPAKSPRNYAGLGYVKFETELDSIRQDDGSLVFAAGGGERIRFPTFHPRSPKITLEVSPYSVDDEDRSLVVGTAWVPNNRYTTNATATYSVNLSIKSLPPRYITKKELTLRPDGAWEESKSQVIERATIPAEVPTAVNYRFDDYYLNRVYNVTGLVNFTKDTSVYTTHHPNGDISGEGRAELGASYRYAFDDTDAEICDSSGNIFTVKKGIDRSLVFDASMDVTFTKIFTPHSINHNSDVTIREWYEIAGERIYYTDARVKWSMSSSATFAESLTEPGSLVLYYGNYAGSAKLDVKCQRRQMLRYDPEMDFLCYVEEQEFAYVWEPSASCVMLSSNGEAATPMPGVPLEGSNEMVNVGQPVAYLVMKLRGVEVLREKLTFNDTYLARTSMIPVTSAYLQPEVEQLPPEYISVEEYRRRIRVLLCTNYQCGLSEVAKQKVGNNNLRENRLRFRPSDWQNPSKQLDDYFLRQGTFMPIYWLQCSYINDATTLSGVMTIYKEVNFLDFERRAYVITKNGVDRHEILPDQRRYLQAT